MRTINVMFFFILGLKDISQLSIKSHYNRELKHPSETISYFHFTYLKYPVCISTLMCWMELLS